MSLLRSRKTKPNLDEPRMRLDWQQRAMQLFLDNFERYRKGEPLRNIVDKRRGY